MTGAHPTAYRDELRCPRCALVTGEERANRGCPACHDEGVAVNMLPRYELSGLSAVPVDARQPGIFRHRALLPVPDGVAPLSLGEGRTPLVRLANLGAELGIDELYVKDESRNPTWSYKDRLVATALTHARARGATRVVVSSSGNAGAAAAAYAAAAGMECVVLTIADVPATIKVLMQAYTPHVVALERPADRWVLMRRLVEDHGWAPTSGFLDPPIGSNSFGVDGYKTISYELVDDLGRAPDVVVIPAAYGDGLVGVHRGFEDLVELGVIARLPRIVAVDPMGAYARAAVDGPAATVPDDDSVAFSIVVDSPTWQGWHAVETSGGHGVGPAGDAEILAAQLRLSRREGLYLEASSAITLLAAERLRAAGDIAADATVVLLGTSSGLKDVGATAAGLTPVPVIEPSLDALARVVGGL